MHFIDIWAGWPLYISVMAADQTVGMSELSNPSKQTAAYLLALSQLVHKSVTPPVLTELELVNKSSS